MPLLQQLLDGMPSSLGRSWRHARSLLRSWSPRRALSVLDGHIHAMGPILSAAGTAGARGGAAVGEAAPSISGAIWPTYRGIFKKLSAREG